MSFNSIKVNILHAGSAYVPEVEAYKRFLGSYGFIVNVFRDINTALKENGDIIIIIIMGYHFFWQKPKNDVTIVHEYHSLGTGRLAKLKDLVRRLIMYKPDGRIFLNKRILDEMGFKDNIPFIYRDMGVPEYFYYEHRVPINEKKYDFGYVGQINERRKFIRFLNGFLEQVPDKSIALIGAVSPKIKKRFNSNSNIHFLGKVNQIEVPRLLLQCRYAINYVPDLYPYNIQTSTKLLEYIALGLPIVTTDYPWLQDFENKIGVRFSKIGEQCQGLRELVDKNQIRVINVDFEQFKWDRILENSSLIQFLIQILSTKKDRDIIY